MNQMRRVSESYFFQKLLLHTVYANVEAREQPTERLRSANAKQFENFTCKRSKITDISMIHSQKAQIRKKVRVFPGKEWKERGKEVISDLSNGIRYYNNNN